MTFQKWLEKNSKCASYKHFDYKISLKDVIFEIQNPNNIEKHSFKPIISYKKITKKYNKSENETKIKEREINYCSHYDRCIYQYYSFLLGNQYEDYVKEHKIYDNVLAYRRNLKKNNIFFANRAFSFIKNYEECIVFVGDFTKFFDNLDHKYLKKQICKVLNALILPNDYYSVFKSLTKYASVDSKELEKTMIKEGIETKDILMSMKELRGHKGLIKQNPKDYGIPQGISISGLLSNVYMIDFDESCKRLAREYNGLYLRYCDDFIFVFPNQKIQDVNYFHKKIENSVHMVPKLELSKEKTQIYYCSKGKVQNCEKEIGKTMNGKNTIDYLGFTYNGNLISIRDKTISKYYYRLYRKIKSINIQRENNLKGKGCSNLYLNYSLKGTKNKMNFLSYVLRCERVFGKSENVNRVLNTHYGKIKKRIKKVGG